MFQGCFCVCCSVFEHKSSTQSDMAPSFAAFFSSAAKLSHFFLFCWVFLKVQPVSCLFFPKNGEAPICFRWLHHFKKLCYRIKCTQIRQTQPSLFIRTFLKATQRSQFNWNMEHFLKQNGPHPVFMSARGGFNSMVPRRRGGGED